MIVRRHGDNGFRAADGGMNGLSRSNGGEEGIRTLDTGFPV
jgi:hypothetical protein